MDIDGVLISQPALSDGAGPAHLAQPAPEPLSIADDKQLPDKIEDAVNLLINHGVFKDDEPARDLFFGRLRNPTLAPSFYQDQYWQAQERAITLLGHNETHADEVPPLYHRFSHDEFPEYSTLLMVNDKKTLVQRSQLSELCYMHAPVVVQYYAIWHNRLKNDPNSSSDHQMLDLRAHVLKEFPPRKLEDHVFRSGGGYSISFLQHILQDDSHLYYPYKVKDYEKCLKEYGPGLVSRFRIHQDFKDQNCHKHHGKPKGGFIGRHAMALVGAKLTGGKWYFLLQNWWKDKQFVEVDAEYLESCKAEVSFVETPQLNVREGLATCKGHFFETYRLDNQDGGHIDACGACAVHNRGTKAL